MNRGVFMINLCIFLISTLIFINTISYSIYEFQNKNKLAGIMVGMLAIFMIIFVNIAMFNLK